MATALKLRSKPKPEAAGTTLAEHLGELRSRVLVSTAAFVVAATAAFLLSPRILSILKHPYCDVAPAHCGFYITGPLDGLSLRVKIAAYGGLFLASPVLLWEFWRFITPGLNSKEKRYAVPFIIASLALFALGCLVAFETFPHALRFLNSVGGPYLHEIYNPINYLSLIVLLMVVFGITFDLGVAPVGGGTCAEAAVEVAEVGHRGHRRSGRSDHTEL